MKHNSVLIFVVLLIFTSCSEWLDVKPIEDIDATDQINTAEGIREVLNGAYIGISQDALYGESLSYGFIEQVAGNHFVGSEENALLHKYTDEAKYNVTDNIFLNAYRVIANLNFLLDNIDEKKSLLSEEEYLMIKAEAMAIRAFLHFDLLRGFAQNYQDAPNAKAIPYIDVFEKRLFKHNTANEVVAKIMLDLNFAEQTLEQVDPIIDLPFSNFDFYAGNTSQINHFVERKFRFNYYAVLAIKSRVYQYLGEKDAASEYAQKVLDKFPYEWVEFLGEQAFYDKVTFSESILVFDVYDLFSKASNKLGSVGFVGGDDKNAYCKVKVFETYTGGVGARDVRFEYNFTYDQYNLQNVSTKYTYKEVAGIPQIKISEMILILAENKLEHDKEGALALINQIRLHRSVTAINPNISKEDLKAELIKEFRKETYLEGQYFFLNKRLKTSTLPTLFEDVVVGDEVYTFPLPQNEIEFGDGIRI